MATQNPGLVSGPGALSQRTDLPPKQGVRRLPSPAYGEQKEFMGQQKAAPMAKSLNQIAPIGLGEPTRRPDEPVTTGVDAGPGAGSSILGMNSSTDTQLQDLSMLAQYMPLMQKFADSPNSTGTMKAFVKYLRSQSE